MLEHGFSLPTPSSLKGAKGALLGEIEAIYSGLPESLKRKYFTASKRVVLDEVAGELGFESEADFLSAISDEFSRIANNQYSTKASIKASGATSGAEETPWANDASAQEIFESQRQYAEIEAKYKGTPLWLKAPNGKPTNLSEKQWVEARTPNFKEWFGDWEKEAWAKEAMDFLEHAEPVAKISGKEFQKDGVKLTDKVSAYFASVGGKAHRAELGDVILDLKGVEDSIGHGIGSLKSAAFMTVKDVIEKGFIFNRESNWKERGWDTAVIVAPIKIGTEDYICEVVVKKVNGAQKFYLHEVEIKRTLDNVFKSVANNGNVSQASKLILGKHLAEVKENASKFLDENGEPKVFKKISSLPDSFKRAYTTSMPKKFRDIISSWDYVSESPYSFSFYNKPGKSWTNTPDGIIRIADHWNFESKGKIHCKTDIDVPNNTHWAIGRYHNGVYKILDVLPVDEDLRSVQAEQNYQLYQINKQRAIDSGIGEHAQISKKNYTRNKSGFAFDSEELFTGKVIRKSPTMITIRTEDGKIVKGKDFHILNPDLLDSALEFYANSENGQIKSATDNVGTFDKANSDIRFSVDEFEDTPIQEFSESQRQYAEIEAKYKNTPLWLKAPNGKPTNLSEKQWVEARTPNFKEKFGDWESIFIQNFLKGKPIVSLDENVLNSTKIDIKKVLEYWTKKYANNKISSQNPSFAFNSIFVDGRIVVDVKTVRATVSKGSISNLDMYFKNKALACIGEVIENGIPINVNVNWKGRGYSSLILTAPVEIDGKPYAVEVVVTRKIAQKRRDGSIIYSNKAYVVDAINIEDLVIQHVPSMQSNASGSMITNSPSPIYNTLIDIFKVKPENISKFVDENGEPKAFVFDNANRNIRANAIDKSTRIPVNDIDQRIGEIDFSSRFRPEKYDDSTPESLGALDELLGENIGLKSDGIESVAQANELLEKIDRIKGKLDARMLKLPELVELAKTITINVPIEVKRKLLRRNSVLGYFCCKDGKKSITLRKDIFKLISPFENYRLATKAMIRTLVRAGYPNASSMSFGQKRDLILKEGLKGNFLSVFEYNKKMLLKEKKTNGFSSEVLDVLGHEISHGADFFNGNTFNRGNILGHIAGVKSFFMHI